MAPRNCTPTPLPGNVAKLTDYFPEKEILKALLADAVIQKALNDKQPRTLAELLQRHPICAKNVNAHFGDALRNFHHMGEIIGRDVENIARRCLRNDQSMAGRTWHDIEEGEGFLVLIDFVTRNLAL